MTEQQAWRCAKRRGMFYRPINNASVLLDPKKEECPQKGDAQEYEVISANWARDEPILKQRMRIRIKQKELGQ